jgi:hypothetical protein
MKKLLPSFLISFAAFALIISFIQLESKPVESQPQEKPDMGFPEDISAMLQTSCYDCHISESSNLKAKSKLNFTKWANMSDAKKVGKLESIAEEVKDGKMPPSRYLDKNPAAALDKEQKDAIIKWANEETDKLMGE